MQTESGGTVLSTNWTEVGKDKVKGSPPPGMAQFSLCENFEKFENLQS